MKILVKDGEVIMQKKIQEGDVILLENGNIEVINMIFQDGHFKSTIIDLEEMKSYKCYGDFNSKIQNENRIKLMEEG